jgi:hypothetical protein
MWLWDRFLLWLMPNLTRRRYLAMRREMQANRAAAEKSCQVLRDMFEAR